MKDKIFISIIMPVYNSGKFLEKAVMSILNQGIQEIELILVDDGSTDGSAEECDNYAKKDKRVKVIHKKNGGICNARNAALNVAKGEYIGFADHDDEYVSGYLMHAHQVAITNNADLVKVGKKEFIIKGDKIQRIKYSKLPYQVYSKQDITDKYFQLVNSDEMDCVWDGLFKKSIIDDFNLRFDERFRSGGEDIDFVQRFLTHVKCFITIDAIYYYHYIRKGISTSTKFKEQNIQAQELVFQSILNTIHHLGININQHRFEYTYLLLRQYVAPICSLYANKNCTIPFSERKNAIKKIKEKSFYIKFSGLQDIYKATKISKKYALLYFLFKYGMYSNMLLLYKLRNKNS